MIYKDRMLQKKKKNWIKFPHPHQIFILGTLWVCFGFPVHGMTSWTESVGVIHKASYGEGLAVFSIEVGFGGLLCLRKIIILLLF